MRASKTKLAVTRQTLHTTPEQAGGLFMKLKRLLAAITLSGAFVVVSMTSAEAIWVNGYARAYNYCYYHDCGRHHWYRHHGCGWHHHHRFCW